MNVYSSTGGLIMTAKYLIYSQENCFYCEQAKNLFRKLDLPYLEVKINKTNKATLLEDLTQKIGETPKTVPVIFDQDHNYIGGYTELKDLLDPA